MTGLLFLSPVFYPTASAPPLLQTILLLNPVTTPIELARAAWFGDSVNWTAAAWQGAALLAALVLARWTFRRLRPGFPDLV
jgi:lipopolysaccharide transport system permease protein